MNRMSVRLFLIDQGRDIVHHLIRIMDLAGMTCFKDADSGVFTDQPGILDQCHDWAVTTDRDVFFMYFPEDPFGVQGKDVIDHKAVKPFPFFGIHEM